LEISTKENEVKNDKETIKKQSFLGYWEPARRVVYIFRYNLWIHLFSFGSYSEYFQTISSKSVPNCKCLHSNGNCFEQEQTIIITDLKLNWRRDI